MKKMLKGNITRFVTNKEAVYLKANGYVEAERKFTRSDEKKTATAKSGERAKEV